VDVEMFDNENVRIKNNNGKSFFISINIDNINDKKYSCGNKIKNPQL
jgi:hypothetical protein